MPIYEFRCKKCGHEFEVEMGMNDEHKAKCVECKSSKTVRVFSIPHVALHEEKWHAARRVGVPKSRLDNSENLRDQREKRKKDPRNERERVSNELHLPDPTKTTVGKYVRKGSA